MDFVQISDCFVDRERREKAFNAWAITVNKPTKGHFDAAVYEIGLKEMERRLNKD